MVKKLFKEYNNAKRKIFEQFSLETNLGYDIELESERWMLYNTNDVYFLSDETCYSLDNITIHESKDFKYKLISGNDGCGGKSSIVLINDLEITNTNEKESFYEKYC
jgi:hypothetical protein